MSLQSKASIFLLPNEVLASDKSKLLRLKNPCTRVASYFLLDEERKNLYDIQGFDEKYRSWFINENVYSDGCIKLATPFNPVFIILPYLSQATKNVPLDQLLEDDQCPEMRCLVHLVEDLSCVADRIGPATLNVWSYNERSTLNWLSKKIDKLSDLLHESKEKTSLTCAFPSDKDSYRVLAFGILSEYLCEELSQKLKDHLKLPQPSSESHTNGTINQSTSKKMKVEKSPNSIVSGRVKKPINEQSATQKALAKSAKGSKSITSFFTKK